MAAAAGAAVVAATPGLAGAAPAPLKGKIKQGLWKINFGQGNKMTLDEMCQAVKPLGVKGFDVIQPPEWPILRKYGMDPLMVGPGDTDYLTGLIHPEAHERVLKGIGAQIELCSKSNVRRIGLTAGQRRGMAYNVAADNAVEVCKRLAPLLEAGKVTLVIENVNDRRNDANLSRQDMVFGHWDWGIEVVERVAHPNVKLLCDIYHLQIMDGDITARIQRDAKHIGHFHVAGVPGRTEIDGRQEVNYRQIAQVIAGLDYDGYVCHEWRPSPGADPLKDIAEAIAIMDA